MKKSGILVLAIAFITMSFTSPIKYLKSSLKVDVTGSTIGWKGYKPTGSHEGTISLKSGTIELDKDQVTGGTFTVDMSSIKDIDASARLEGHLKSKDFFEVEAFPTSNFIITNVKAEEGKSLVSGKITIKGITKEISFPATIVVTDSKVTLKSETIKINRADFNIKYKSKSFFNNLKEKFINDEFDLQVSIVANK